MLDHETLNALKHKNIYFLINASITKRLISYKSTQTQSSILIFTSLSQKNLKIIDTNII